MDKFNLLEYKLPSEKAATRTTMLLGHQVKDKQLKPQQDPFAIQRVPGFFSVKALRKHVVVDIGLTIRTVCIFGSFM